MTDVSSSPKTDCRRDARTTNGRRDARTTTGKRDARTTNGRRDARTTNGRRDACTTNWRRFRLGLVVLAVDAAVLLILFALGWRALAREEQQQDHAGRAGASPAITQLRGRLAEERPQVVFVGDSLVSEGIDPDLFTEKTGAPSIKMASPGSGSAYWYLLIKNVLAPSPERPRTVVLCFRDIHLIDPARDTTGKYAERIGELESGPEPEVDRLAYLASDRPLEQARLRATRVFDQRNRLASNISSGLKQAVSAMCGASDLDSADLAITRLFDYHHMNTRLATQRQQADESHPAAPDAGFDTAVAHSFLPSIVAICRDAHMQLVLVSMKRRPETRELNPEEKDETTRRSTVRSLHAWCSEKQVPLLDYSDDGRLTLDLYADGDHLNRTSGRTLFTGLLVDALGPILSQEARP